MCVSSCGHISIRCARALHDDTGWLLLVNREIQVCLLFVCLLFAACMLADLLACLFACCLLACLWIACCLFACLLACYLVGLPALSFNLILNFRPMQSTRRLNVRSDPHAESVAHALMPSSYAAAHAEPKEHRADRRQLLHTIAYSGVGAPQVHKSASDSCSMAHTSKI